MKIKIIDVDYVTDDESITLRECGFEIGDVVEVSGKYNNGELSIQAIRETDFVNVGNEVSISEFEYEVVEE
ncbi:hypothetical protein OPT79_75 [Klebsiella phage vB_KpnD_Opt-79]|uniref:Uncharacterized protein n=1 Tax=Escherichia phage vB_EcoD_Sadiya TaxID=2902684 RepID=A0AC61TRM0_9CAUD|nr:hypothetical protein OPT719_73 [Escherichia phage vB_EcoD_Opt-719]UGO52838.1 hypothetical protein OPT79_75 [Klebsiella phage vB_KpnD_Opt-79]UGV22585.1 putative methyltransferase type 11 [Escherichia phage vB_ EcoD_Phleasolo]UGV22764.1 hypothetical protein SADIYA_75 [Escherichia phage vB_EcoD_Sadiya]